MNRIISYLNGAELAICSTPGAFDIRMNGPARVIALIVAAAFWSTVWVAL